jgi:putative flippase GtrA
MISKDTELIGFKKWIGKKTLTQLFRYLITGFTAFGVEYTLYVFLLQIMDFHYITASVTVYVIVFWFVFLTNRFWSFQSKGDIRKQLFQYGLLFLFNLFISNVFLMYFFTDILGISYYLSPMLKMGCVVCWNFLIYKYIIYQ